MNGQPSRPGPPAPPVRIRPSSGAHRSPAPPNASRPIGDVLPRLWEAICRAAPPWRRQLAEAWPGIVGEHYVRHLKPGPSEGADRRTLIVYAGHSVIRFEAERELRDLADRIRAAVPAAPVRRVRFMVDQPQSDSG